MQLQDLIAGLPIARVNGPAEVCLAGLTDDSRRVTPGGLFVCRGEPSDTTAGYIAVAVERGAAAVLTEEGNAGCWPAMPEGVTHLTAQPGTPVDQRLAGQLAERFYGHPARQLTLVGITGTNGKTTTATLAQHLLRAAGRKPGLLGTIHLDTGHPDGPRPAELTTPGAIDLTALLAEMVAHGCDSAVMEVSSHALHQGRADHLRFAAAAFTNLTQDHLDYHGSMECYADAKALLFESLDHDATAVLNGDDPAAARMARDCAARIIKTHVAHDPRSRLDPSSPGQTAAVAHALDLTASTSRASFTGPWGTLEADLPLVGPHNLANAIQAGALVHAVTGLEPDTLRTALDACPPVPGRLEPVGPDWPAPPSEIRNPKSVIAYPTVLVDYAHTPDALDNVARALRGLTPPPGRLVVLFGCGGDRDRAKRPLMATAACRYANVVVLTSDNPRTEDPRRILNDAAEGFPRHPKSDIRNQKSPETHIEIDRAKAITLAVRLARPSDTVLIAGKGHEDYQVVGTEKAHFDDREHAAAALKARTTSPHPV